MTSRLYPLKNLSSDNQSLNNNSIHYTSRILEGCRNSKGWTQIYVMFGLSIGIYKPYIYVYIGKKKKPALCVFLWNTDINLFSFSLSTIFRVNGRHDLFVIIQVDVCQYLLMCASTYLSIQTFNIHLAGKQSLRKRRHQKDQINIGPLMWASVLRSCVGPQRPLGGPTSLSTHYRATEAILMAGFPTITYFVQNFTYLEFLFVENML